MHVLSLPVLERLHCEMELNFHKQLRNTNFKGITNNFCLMHFLPSSCCGCLLRVFPVGNTCCYQQLRGAPVIPKAVVAFNSPEFLT